MGLRFALFAIAIPLTFGACAHSGGSHSHKAHANLEIRDLAPRVLNARVTAPDRATVEAASRFYENAFGMHEVRRIDMENLFEVFLNFGSSTEDAKANPGTRIAIIENPRQVSPSSHIVIQVDDIETALSRAEAAGGTIQSGPTEASTLPLFLGFVLDPAGNRIELVQYK